MGNGILQFKFSSQYQLEWGEKNGPWNFENNLLALKQWEKCLTTAKMEFSHSPFWVQVWGLPFEHVSEETRKDIWCKIGNYIETNKRAWQSDQAKFIRIRVELQSTNHLGEVDT